MSPTRTLSPKEYGGKDWREAGFPPFLYITHSTGHVLGATGGQRPCVGDRRSEFSFGGNQVRFRGENGLAREIASLTCRLSIKPKEKAGHIRSHLFQTIGIEVH
jgi:hypothetical protein